MIKSFPLPKVESVPLFLGDNVEAIEYGVFTWEYMKDHQEFFVYGSFPVIVKSGENYFTMIRDYSYLENIRRNKSINLSSYSKWKANDQNMLFFWDNGDDIAKIIDILNKNSIGAFIMYEEEIMKFASPVFCPKFIRCWENKEFVFVPMPYSIEILTKMSQEDTDISFFDLSALISLKFDDSRLETIFRNKLSIIDDVIQFDIKKTFDKFYFTRFFAPKIPHEIDWDSPTSLKYNPTRFYETNISIEAMKWVKIITNFEYPLAAHIVDTELNEAKYYTLYETNPSSNFMAVSSFNDYECNIISLTPGRLIIRAYQDFQITENDLDCIVLDIYKQK